MNPKNTPIKKFINTNNNRKAEHSVTEWGLHFYKIVREDWIVINELFREHELTDMWFEETFDIASVDTGKTYVCNIINNDDSDYHVFFLVNWLEAMVDTIKHLSKQNPELFGIEEIEEPDVNKFIKELINIIIKTEWDKKRIHEVWYECKDTYDNVLIKSYCDKINNRIVDIDYQCSVWIQWNEFVMWRIYDAQDLSVVK